MKHEEKKQQAEQKLQKFCSKHKSIWGKNSWWCLFALWQEIGDLCIEEYLEVEI